MLYVKILNPDTQKIISLITAENFNIKNPEIEILIDENEYQTIMEERKSQGFKKEQSRKKKTADLVNIGEQIEADDE